MSVLSALNNIYAQREPERQWARAVGIMKDMSEMEIATSWKTFSAQIDTHNVADAIITHSQYKSIFDGVLSEAITGRQQFIETDNTKRSTPNTEGVEQLLKKYSDLVEIQDFRAARLFAMYAEQSGSDPTHQAYDTPEYIRRSDERPSNTAPGKVNSDQREVGKNNNTIKKIEEIKELMNKQMTDSERQFKEIKQTILRILALQNTDGVERIESTAHTDKQFQKIVDILNTLQGAFSTLDPRITSMESAIAASTNAGERTVDTLNEYKNSMETLNTKITNMESKLPEGIKDDLKTIQEKMASVQLNIEKINENNAKTAVRTEEIALMMKSTDQLKIQREKLAIHLQDLIDEIHQINDDAETIHSEYDQDLNELQTHIKQEMETTEAAVQAAIDYPLEDRSLLAVDAIVAATLATIQAYMGGHDVRDQ
jgi:predicted  nucleic acid-binding Zn-ribbon protein